MMNPFQKFLTRLAVRVLMLAVLFVLSSPAAFAQAGRIYTQPVFADTGGIAGRISGENERLTHAVAIERDHVRVYLAVLSQGGRAFRFEHLPVGKYDLVLFTQSGVVYEGLGLGRPPQLSETSAQNLAARVAASDGFFNGCHVHRYGVEADGETAFAFVERWRAEDVLKQNAEKLNQLVRRFEVVELTQATDDWQLSNARHIYREGEPIPEKSGPRSSVHMPVLEGLRVIQSVKELGEIALPQ